MVRWNELVEIISNLNENDLFLSKQIQNLSFSDRPRILKSYLVLIAHYFQYREEMLFKEITVDGPLGRVKYYAIRQGVNLELIFGSTTVFPITN